ncbi:MAG: hypothetical protein E7022_00400 [Desulfovibrio desulfuricans]|nr:hypothetical protein [Desulfovibrio desulfuricans]
MGIGAVPVFIQNLRRHADVPLAVVHDGRAALCNRVIGFEFHIGILEGTVGFADEDFPHLGHIKANVAFGQKLFENWKLREFVPQHVPIGTAKKLFPAGHVSLCLFHCGFQLVDLSFPQEFHAAAVVTGYMQDAH